MTSQDSDDDPTPTQESDEDPTPKTPRKRKLTSQDSHEDSTPKRKHSHHSQVKCKVPGCKFHGQEIKRHLRTHVKKGELEAENIEAMAELCQHGKRQRRPAFRPANTKTQSAMTRKKWCPMENYTTVTSYMDKHSRDVHKLSKDSVEYRVKLKAAKPYSGLGEVHALVKDREESLGEGKEPPEQDLPVLLSEAGEDVTKPVDTSRGKDDEDDGQKEEDNEHDVDQNNDDDDEEHDEDDEDNEDDDEDDEDNEDGEDDEYNEDDEHNEDDEDDDNAAKIKSQPGALEYYTATKYDDNRHQWLCGFYRYLGLPDAGYKKDALKLQHVGQVKLLLAALDKDGDDIMVLGEEQGHAVWSRWVDPQLQSGKKAPGTIISYLTSLEKFLRFITSRLYDFKSMLRLHPNYRVLFKDLIPSLKGWRATVDASTQDRQVRRYIDECDAMITMKEMQQVKQSEPYTSGERYLLEASEGKKLTFEEFALVRDLLLVKFALLTSTRPAPLNNAVLRDFQTAREERRKRIILVPKHKRS